ncbi:hypothetical protein AVEN_15969-1 [Araneus ventricosus]|uniref:Uncharacterized protein n=1 Tax=Araneus ventricosus TaxID=182803 RepID=A0A4Y2IDJ9_ARAVE|nr:hypothetical protein AVEN_15969-1 [Araneus ventricosus]
MHTGFSSLHHEAMHKNLVCGLAIDICVKVWFKSIEEKSSKCILYSLLCTTKLCTKNFSMRTCHRNSRSESKFGPNLLKRRDPNAYWILFPVPRSYTHNTPFCGSIRESRGKSITAGCLEQVEPRF